MRHRERFWMVVWFGMVMWLRMVMWFMMVMGLMVGKGVPSLSRESVNLMLKIKYLFWSQFLQCQQSRQVLGYVVEILLEVVVSNVVVLLVMSNQSNVFVEDGCMMVWI